MRSIYLFGTSGDPTWDNVDLTIWTAFEIAVAVICCNLPSIAGLLTHYRRIYFPGRVIDPTDSARHLKWTGTTATSGLASPRYPLSPRFPPSPRFPSEKDKYSEDLMSIDDDTFTVSDESWLRASTTLHFSQSTSVRDNNLELGNGSQSRNLPWNMEGDPLPPHDQSMSPIQRIRASLRTSRSTVGWPFPEPTVEHRFVSTSKGTTTSNQYRTSNTNTYPTTTITTHPATQTPTILSSPQRSMQTSLQGSPNPSPPSFTSIEEGQTWPLPLRPPPFHVRRQNRDFTYTNINSKRAFPRPLPIVISPCF
jgi:hypothetical protein